MFWRFRVLLAPRECFVSLENLFSKYPYLNNILVGYFKSVDWQKRDALCQAQTCGNTECILVAALTSRAMADISINYCTAVTRLLAPRLIPSWIKSPLSWKGHDNLIVQPINVHRLRLRSTMIAFGIIEKMNVYSERRNYGENESRITLRMVLKHGNEFEFGHFFFDFYNIVTGQNRNSRSIKI